MGIEVTVVNDNHFEGWLESVFRVGEIYMTNARDMVANVLVELRVQPTPPLATPAEGGWGRTGSPRLPLPRKPVLRLSRLNLIDHASAGGFRLGSDLVTIAGFPAFAPLLVSLRPHFESDGIVHLQMCDTAQNVPLLQLLADTFGVDVVGGTGTQVPTQRWNKGRYVRVHPFKGSGRKPEDWYFNGFEAVYVTSLGR